MRAASRRDVVEQLWWPLHTSTKRTNTRFQLYTDKVLCNITSSCVGGDGDGTLSSTIPSFFFFLFLIFLLFPRWALGVVGLYEKRIRLVKVMNLETLRHNCLTPPLLLLNWWWWCGVVVAYSFNCRLVSINFLRTVKRGKVTIITNDLFGCQSKSLCTCVRTCCIFFFLWIVLLIFLFLFFFFSRSCTSWTTMPDAKLSSTNSLTLCRKEVRVLTLLFLLEKRNIVAVWGNYYDFVERARWGSIWSTGFGCNDFDPLCVDNERS